MRQDKNINLAVSAEFKAHLQRLARMESIQRDLTVSVGQIIKELVLDKYPIPERVSH